MFCVLKGNAKKNQSTNFAMDTSEPSNVIQAKRYLLRVCPNGSCFYIAARLAIELKEIMKRHSEKTSKPETTNLNGFSPEVLASAEVLRSLICEWYRRGLDRVMPELGHYDEASKRPFKRGDLLALEAIRHGKDVPEEGPSRDLVIQSVLGLMRKAGTWASTPEYIALSFFTKCNVEIWTYSQDKKSIEVRDQFKAAANAQATIRLFFSNHH